MSCHNTLGNISLVLLASVESVLPRGAEEWELVASKFNRTSHTKRNAYSLRNKFKSLSSARKPTGATALPPSIARAKLIREHIEHRVEAEVVVRDAAPPQSVESAPQVEEFGIDHEGTVS
jgi:hypothetical protein